MLDLIEEPVAAAISYGIFQKNSTMGHSEKIMVFDFGGGTLMYQLLIRQPAKNCCLGVGVDAPTANYAG